MLRIGLVLAASVLSAAQISPQTAAGAATVRHLDPTKPTVLISFERSAIEKGGNRLLLRITNNSNTDIEIPTYSDYKTASGQTAIVPLYEVRSTGYWEWKNGNTRWTNGPKPPRVEAPYDLIGEYVLRAGESVSFQRPKSPLGFRIGYFPEVRIPLEKGHQTNPSIGLNFALGSYRKKPCGSRDTGRA